MRFQFTANHNNRFSACQLIYTLNRRNTTAFRPWIRAVTQ